MVTPLESYFLYQAERPRTRAEQQADDSRSAGFIASITPGSALLRRRSRRLENQAARPAISSR
jgi:hypothetical protein